VDSGRNVYSYGRADGSFMMASMAREFASAGCEWFSRDVNH
jgi:hypothetical protein